MNLKELTEILKKKGLKLTIQRIAIFNSIFSRTDHPTTEDVYNSLKIDYPTISISTVYKTLHLFKEIGIIQELISEGGNIRYDPNRDLHINITCSKCGSIEDYYDDELEHFWDKILEHLPFHIQGQRIDIYYLCKNCR